MKSREFDVVIFGASGFVGKYTVLEATAALKDLKWAVAGRSKHKLKLILNEISLKAETDLSTIPILIADANNLEALEELIGRCKVLINCSGPYQLLAENILTTCIIAGTHYVDMCNDAYFNELMELKYHDKAVENNVYIISSCGFQSFPIDMGLNFVRKNFNGTVNHVNAYVHYTFFNNFFLPLCSLWTTTSWFSLLLSCSKVAELSLGELSRRSKYHEKGIMVHFPFIDQQVVERSQYLNYVHRKLRPIQFYKYMEFPSFFLAFLFIIWCLFISVLSQFLKTRNLINSYPRLFSLGMFSPYGPDEYMIQKMSSYKIRLHAMGWSRTCNSPANDLSQNDIMDNFMEVEISGENPFYGSGCLCLLLSAKTLLEESEKMPGRGGVYSPGFAFQNINLFDNTTIFQNYLRIRIL